MKKSLSVLIPLFVLAAFPLIASAQAQITGAAVLRETNAARQARGLSPLVEDGALAEIAKERVMDMFEREYFAHASPDGVRINGLAKEEGYAYSIIGENLAFGDFDGAADVVAAWLASPGHRANILEARYTSVGIAAGYGEFEGEPAWIIVQAFSRPAAAAASCPQELSSLAQSIAARKKFADSLAPLLKEYGREARTAPKEFVMLYEKFASLLGEFRSVLDKEVAFYNKEAAPFKSCKTF